MFLKRVEIFGFKSFADKSKIDFGDGISTIIGPNGCGKSNVTEAIRWVLGEQSVKGIRLEKMDNVIFNGTDHRHPLNVAEVTLTFSNEKNILPLEFSEVSIKRRIFRSSNSEYYINNSQVTLKELKELLADTGIGTSEYMVMGQGRIDQILEAKPLERRSVLEEAAGIKKYRIRSIEGTRRREKVKENIVQIEQILQEVEKQHKTLKQQSEKAIRYRSLSDIVFECEVVLICQKIQEYHTQLGKANEQLKKGIEKQEKEEKAREKMHVENEAFLQEVKTKEHEVIELQKRLSVIDAEKNANKRILRTNLEHVEEINEQRVSFQSQIKNNELRKKELEKEIDLLEKDKKDQNKNLVSTKTRIKDAEAKIIAHKEKIHTLRDSRGLIMQREEHMSRALETHQQELRAVVDTLAEELDKRISQTSYSVNEQNKLEAQVLENNQQLKSLVQALNDFINDAAISKEEVKIKDIEKHIKTLRVISEKINQDFLVYRDSVPTFLNEFLDNDGVLAHKHLIDEKINTLYKDLETCKRSRKEVHETIEKIHNENTNVQQYLYEMQIQKNNYVQQLDSIERDEQRVERTVSETLSQLVAQKGQLKGLDAALEKWREEYQQHEKKYKELDKEDSKIQKDIEFLSKEIGKRVSEAHMYQKKIDFFGSAIRDIRMDIQKSREKVSEIDTRLAMVQENFRERHGELINIYLVDKTYLEKSKKDSTLIKQRLTHTKQEMTQLGSVNLLAAEEFERVDERYQHLIGQLQDLNEADANLQSVIEKIEVESCKKMEKTFYEVRKHFRNVFTRVMEGGTADLILVGSDDILSAGLEIVAQPPEKKTQYLSQLSGGERTLIALSLLFALHSVKPAPFCLLDELDAPLDDRNIDCFLDLLHRFKEGTQFIIISHNKRTIAQAQNIIGVTMEERGVSKLIGVRLERNEEAV